MHACNNNNNYYYYYDYNKKSLFCVGAREEGAVVENKRGTTSEFYKTYLSLKCIIKI